ncbi:MAG: Na/Pi cotransporter family protein [Marinosulfonomonas sp.]|nr:Na/Pi cotransporter family protein [Marinosulfonomonas sp.]
MIFLVLQLAGAAALLLWSVRLIRTGVERAYSVQLRRWMRHSAKSLPSASATGALAALMLQSSTAVAVLTTNFAAAGTLSAVVGLAILLGADVGSAVVAQVLLVRASWLAPLLLLAGVSLFLRAQKRTIRQSGRILIGIALVFVSLDMIGAATTPLRESEGVLAVMRYLSTDPVSAFLIGAAFAWIVHSSVAAILLFVTLVIQQILSIDAAIALVLGANLGGAVIAFTLTLGARLSARRIVIGNLILRGGGALIGITAFAWLQPSLGWLGVSPFRQVINFHLLFNIAVLLVGFPLIQSVTRLLEYFLPEVSPGSKTPVRISALNQNVVDRPEMAIACAAREVLRMGEAIEAMLSPVMGLFDAWDTDLADAIRTQEEDVNRMNFETKLYLAQLHRSGLDQDTARKSMDLSNSSVNFEAAGDAISKNMLRMANRMQKDGLSFSKTGFDELCDFHDRVLANVQLALSVLMTGDAEVARTLAEEKERVREVEQQLQVSHLGRLHEGTTESIETSNIHQEMIRVLKQVNTAFTMVAYPILEETGDLLSSRLTDTDNS